MKSYGIPFTLLALVVLISGCAQTPEEPVVDSARIAADIESIKANEEQRFPAAITASDTEAALEVYTDDAIVMWPGVPARMGKEAIRALLDDWFSRYREDLRQTAEEVEVLGDWAWARGRSTATMAPLEGGESRVQTGKYLIVLKRQADGSWKTHRACGNADHSAPGFND
jgi:uncharacterized protein (TIGR02246 family)